MAKATLYKNKQNETLAKANRDNIESLEFVAMEENMDDDDAAAMGIDDTGGQSALDLLGEAEMAVDDIAAKLD